MDQGANSTVVYHNSYITKIVTDDEQYEQPLNVAAAREVFLMTLAKTGYKFIPEVYSLSNNMINMQKINGMRLSNYIQNTITQEEYIEIVQRVEQMIVDVIKTGVYHRDTSPDNIMIDNDGNLWLVDFGRSELLCDGDDIYQKYADEFFLFIDTIGDILAGYNLKEYDIRYKKGRMDNDRLKEYMRRKL